MPRVKFNRTDARTRKNQACDQNRHALETASRRRPIPKAQSRAINPVSPLVGFRKLKARAPGRPPVRGRPSFRRTHSQKLGRSKRSAFFSKGTFRNSRSGRLEVKSGRRGIGAQRVPEQNSKRQAMRVAKPCEAYRRPGSGGRSTDASRRGKARGRRSSRKSAARFRNVSKRIRPRNLFHFFWIPHCRPGTFLVHGVDPRIKTNGRPMPRIPLKTRISRRPAESPRPHPAQARRIDTAANQGAASLNFNC